MVAILRRIYRKRDDQDWSGLFFNPKGNPLVEVDPNDASSYTDSEKQELKKWFKEIVEPISGYLGTRRGYNGNEFVFELMFETPENILEFRKSTAKSNKQNIVKDKISEYELIQTEILDLETRERYKPPPVN